MDKNGNANPASPALAIEVRGLTKNFGSHQALRGVDLDVRRGESLVIFGPNGAGKTTLIKLLAGIMNPSSGAVTVNGLGFKDNAEEARRHIGVVTHQTFLYGNLTAYENLEFYCRMYDVPDRARRIEQVINRVGMKTRLHDRVGTFSRGMQQRVSIARAILHNPSIILLDEPESGLDQDGAAMLWEIMREEQRTVILTIHSLERGLATCRRLLILVRGKIGYEGQSQGIDLAGLKQTYDQCTRACV